MLAPYQEQLISAAADVIGANWFSPMPRLRILDSGCDPSGQQLRHVAELTRGEVVGINPAPGFPSEEARAAAGERVTLLYMDGCALDFPDHSFDLVLSANVMEHVPAPERYLRECARVLKPGGLAYIETAPVWTGPRGHHIHEDMVERASPDETGYRNDGSVIPDWSHLSYNEEKMKVTLERSGLLQTTVDYILGYLYHSDDLNRCGWRGMEQALRHAFPRSVQIAAWPAGDARIANMPKDGKDDYSVYGFRAICRHRPPNPVLRRLIWRLRRMGL
jgi:SAM-dependent methyltransferase